MFQRYLKLYEFLKLKKSMSLIIQYFRKINKTI